MLQAAVQESNDFKEEYVQRFEALPFENKILFSAKSRRGKSVVFLEEYQLRNCVDNMVVNRRYERYFDMVAWLNSGVKHEPQETGVYEKINAE